MEYGTIAREIHIDATPEVVYAVITEPEHIAQWWGFLRLTEAGFREIGWEAAQLEAHHRSHCAGWDQHLPNLAAYAAGLVPS